MYFRKAVALHVLMFFLVEILNVSTTFVRESLSSPHHPKVSLSVKRLVHHFDQSVLVNDTEDDGEDDDYITCRSTISEVAWFVTPVNKQMMRLSEPPIWNSEFAYQLLRPPAEA